MRGEKTWCLLERMRGTGVRKVEGSAEVSALPDLSMLGRAERIDALRVQMQSMGAAVLKPQERPEEEASPHDEKQDIVAAPSVISEIFPLGGLPRRAVSQFSDQPSLVVEFLAHVTSQGGHAAVVGWKDFGFAGIGESGGVYENIIAIPDPGLEPLNVAAVLCEGLDLVVYKGPDIALSPSRARPLLSKLRKGTAALMMVGTSVVSPALTVQAEIANYIGIGPGRGRIRGVGMDVRVISKGQRPTKKTIVISRPQDKALLDILQADKPKPALKVV